MIRKEEKDIMIDTEIRIPKIKKVLNIGRIKYCGENAKKRFRVGWVWVWVCLGGGGCGLGY